MPDEQEAVASPGQSDPFVPPAQIEESVWTELFPKGQSAAQPAPTLAAVAAPSEAPASAAPAVDPAAAAQAAVAQMLPQIVAQIAALKDQGQTTTQSQRSVEDAVVEDLKAQAGPGANEAAIREMVKTMVRVSQDQTQPKIAALEKQIADLTAVQARGANDQVLQSFDALIERRCVEAGIDSKFEKGSMRALVIQEGMKQYGSSFDMAKADRLFRQLNSERVKLRNSGETPDTPAKKAAAEPPVKAAKGNASAVEGIREGLNNPKSKGWGFRGRNFQNVVKQSLERALG